MPSLYSGNLRLVVGPALAKKYRVGALDTPINVYSFHIHSLKLFLHLRRSVKKLLSQPEGRSERGIGYSFQLAITTARKILIAYGTATAQSY